MNTGRNNEQKETDNNIIALIDGTVTPKYPEGSLESLGYCIKPSPRGGGFMLYKIGKKELDPIDDIKETQKWLVETGQSINVPIDALKKAILIAKNTPKKKSSNETSKISTKTFEILTNKLSRIDPDSGIIADRPYLGIWLTAKVQSENGTKIQQIFHLLFNDGELIPADQETLNSKDIFLHSEPIYTALKLGINTVMNLSEMPAVNPHKILTDLVDQLKKYVEFDDPRYYSLLAYWIIGTYFHKRFNSFPYLFINALKRSGKTKLLEVLALLAYNAIFSPNMSTSALFRLIQSAGATILLDESEDLIDPEKKADFKSLLLSGYKRGAFVYRSEKGTNDSYIPVPFNVYSPKAIANINGLNDVLEDRCITITMKRGRNLEIINKDLASEDPYWEQLRDSLARLYFQEATAIEATYVQMDKIDKVIDDLVSVGCVGSVGSVGLNRVREKKILYVARTWEMWRPLFSIAKYIHIFSPTSISPTQPTQPTQPTLNYLFEDLLSLSIDLILEKESENTTDTGEAMLIMGLLRLVKKDDFYKPKAILDSALEFTDSLPGWFNVVWVGKTFKRLGFKEKRRMGRGIEYRLIPLQVQDMADRLGIKLPVLVDKDLVKAHKLTPTPGRFCSSEEKGVSCALEAVYDLNGNLFCLDHYEEEKESLRKINKIVCLDDT
jgi:hypothetical protein